MADEAPRGDRRSAVPFGSLLASVIRFAEDARGALATCPKALSRDPGGSIWIVHRIRLLAAWESTRSRDSSRHGCWSGTSLEIRKKAQVIWPSLRSRPIWPWTRATLPRLNMRKT